MLCDGRPGKSRWWIGVGLALGLSAGAIASASSRPALIAEGASGTHTRPAAFRNWPRRQRVPQRDSRDYPVGYGMAPEVRNCRFAGPGGEPARTSSERFWWDEPAYKPDSVAPEGTGDHPSAAAVTSDLRARACDLPDDSGEQPSNAVTGPKALLGLAPGGVYRATPVTWGAGGLLHHRFTLTQPCDWAVCSLWHCPAGRPGWVLPTALL